MFERSTYENTSQETENEFPVIQPHEVRLAGDKLKAGKAPGPDGVPIAAVKLLFKEHSAAVAESLTSAIRAGEFPLAWKQAEVVLIPKGNGGYRPICLLNALAKGYETIIEERLRQFAEKCGLLSPVQFGFRKHRSALTAIHRILSRAEQVRESTICTRQLLMVTLLDVRNAFNSLPWKTILDTLVRKNVPPYLIKVISGYLKERSVSNGNLVFPMTAGVPQGSILGPLLWNLAYDDVLRQTGLPPGIELIAYADDLAVVAQAKTEDELELNTNKALHSTAKWMKAAGLALAPEKSEIILLTGRRRVRPLHIQVAGQTIKFVKEARYLGITLDTSMTGLCQIKKATEKASKVANSIARILPNVHGPRARTRKLLMAVAESIALFGAAVWARATLKSKTAKLILRKTQRIAALRVIQGYRTISTNAALLLAGEIPWDLKASERQRLWDIGTPTESDKERERDTTIDYWQAEWDAIPFGAPGRSLRTLLPNIRAWIGRPGGDLTFYLTQVLTGHGNFQSYLYRIGKAPSETCLFCNEAVEDTPQHTLLRCQTWEESRIIAIRQVRGRWSRTSRTGFTQPEVHDPPRNGLQEFVEYILGSTQAWELGAAVAQEVLKAKHKRCKERQTLFEASMTEESATLNQTGSRGLGQSALDRWGNP